MNNEHDGLEKLMRGILLKILFAYFKGIAAQVLTQKVEEGSRGIHLQYSMSKVASVPVITCPLQARSPRSQRS
ncbi:hypothetical protein [Pseudomonas putida]